MIVPFPPGAGVDVVARLVTPALSERLRQNVVIDNRSGAGGTIGAGLAAKSPADGYTVLMATPSQVFSQNVYRGLPYDLARDFAPITLVAVTPNLFVVNASVPAATVKEFIALARAKPRQLNFASAGAGTASHLAGELFKSLTGVELTHVPYKGAAGALTAVLGGEVQAAFFSIPSTLPHLKSGRLRALGIGSATRSDLLPGVPAIAESGVAGYDATTWYGALVPARTPRAILETLHRGFVQSLEVPALREHLLAQGAEPRPTTQREFAAHLRAETEKYARLARDMGIKPE
jgi:tripartite-type tricarboxylate transporter receptor subunit TctC